MNKDNNTQSFDFDFVIVGSGFGGSVSACRLTEKGYRVAVIEQGKRWKKEDFPESNMNPRKYLWRPSLGLQGFFNIRFFRHMLVVCGNAVGGGSITYGNTLLVPPESVWSEGSWAGTQDWAKVMPGHFAAAQKMLGVVDNKLMGDADHVLKKMAENAGVGHTFKPTRVATFFDPKDGAGGETYPDPYFNGEGPERSSCTGCGGCMVGCKVGAKNTLDLNYLYFAEKRGAKVFEQTRVTAVKPLNGKSDGSDGYEIYIESSTNPFKRNRRSVRARSVVFAASSLGTMELLFKQKQDSNLPNISNALGKQVRTNSESLIGARFRGGKYDMSKGVAIGSSIHIDQHTHIEAVRFREGSDFTGLLVTLMGRHRGNMPRVFSWLGAMVRHPVEFVKAHIPFGFAKQTIIMLCMQTLDGHLDMKLERPWYFPFRRMLRTTGKPIPAFIPQVNKFLEEQVPKMGGVNATTTTEMLFNIPTTAHCMGGAAIADSPARGVVDYRCRVFGYQNMYICDGSILGANLGVNPSLTITALTEHAMSHIPAAADAPWNQQGISTRQMMQINQERQEMQTVPA